VGAHFLAQLLPGAGAEGANPSGPDATVGPFVGPGTFAGRPPCSPPSRLDCGTLHRAGGRRPRPTIDDGPSWLLWFVVAAPPFIVPDERALTVFTDGACLPGPRRGGVGIHLVHCDDVGNETVFDLDEPGYSSATNNQMELQAVITALRAINDRRVPEHLLRDIRKIDVYTDATYVVENLSNAIFLWPANGWMTSSGAPVLNADLWKSLVHEYKKLRRNQRVEIKWGNGHSASNPHNKTADKLAKASAKRPTRVLPGAPSVRRKKTDSVLELGTVPMLGQRLTIRIITAEYLRTQRLHRYRYEVMSRTSSVFGRVDIAYSEDPTLRPGHGYYVTMGADHSLPTIMKCHREVLSDVRPHRRRTDSTPSNA
jgi:ribonuclease HI